MSHFTPVPFVSRYIKKTSEGSKKRTTLVKKIVRKTALKFPSNIGFYGVKRNFVMVRSYSAMQIDRPIWV